MLFNISALNIPHQDSEVSHIVTLSIGIASRIPSLNSSPKNLIAQADTALYTTKNRGRNCYVVNRFVSSAS